MSLTRDSGMAGPTVFANHEDGTLPLGEINLSYQKPISTTSGILDTHKAGENQSL